MPRKDILRSVQTIVREYQQLTGCSVLSVDLLSKRGHPGNPRGRTKSSLKRCWISDIPDIVDLSFKTGVFTAAREMSARGRRHLHWQPNFSHPFRPAGVNGGTTIPFVSASYFVLVFSASKICVGQPAFARAFSHLTV